MECKIIFGINWCGINEETEEIVTEHLMTVFSVCNNGKDRKGKYKRIRRPEKFNKLINYFTEKKVLEKYSTTINERKESFRKRDEKYFKEGSQGPKYQYRI
jgi:ribosomal protein S15P/S13E